MTDETVTVSVRPRRPRSRKPSSTLDDVARDRVQQWLTARGWSQATLAKRLRVSPSWVTRYLQGGFNLDLTWLGRMAQVFGHKPAALIMTGPDDPDEALLVEGFRAMDQRARRVALDFARLYVRSEPDGPPTRRSSE
jgi:transcriptional regulator with XRE-family HTH domain